MPLKHQNPIIQVVLTFSIPGNAWTINIWNAAPDSCAKTLPLPATRVEVRRKYAWQDYRLRRKFWFNVKNVYRITFTLEPAVDGGGPRQEFFSGEYRNLYIQRYSYQKLLGKVRVLIISIIQTHFDFSLICEC